MEAVERPEAVGALEAAEARAELAAEAFVEQVRRYRANPVRQPQPLKGMNVDHLRRIWSWSDSDWQKLWDTYREYLSGDRSGSGSDRAPLFYFPIENAASSIVEFLIGTPQRSHAAVWRDLLKTAQSKNARLVEYRLERASPERRAELQALTRE